MDRGEYVECPNDGCEANVWYHDTCPECERPVTDSARLKFNYAANDEPPLRR